MPTDHVNTSPTLSTIVYIMSILFLPFFPWFYSYVCINCHIRKCAQTTWTVHQHCQQQYLSVYSFSHFFPWLCDYICANSHIWKCTQTCKHYSNIVHNGLHHVYSFSFFFSDFLAIFALLTIFGNMHRPCKQYPILSTTICIMSLLFFSFFSWFSGYIYVDYHIRKCAQTM